MQIKHASVLVCHTGLVENIDVAAALDRVMPRTRLANVRFGMMIGRERGMVGGEDTYGEYTRELSPLSPDKDLVLSQRPRPRQVCVCYITASPHRRTWRHGWRT